MKKLALLAALLCMLGCFFGCMPEGSQGNDQTTPSPSVTDPIHNTTAPPVTSGSEVVPTNPPVSYSQIPLSSISAPVVQESFYAEDGTLLLNYIYQNIFLIHPDAAVADSVYLALVNAIDHSQGLQSALQQARQDYPASSSWSSYRYEVLFDTTRIDQSVLSIQGHITSATSETSSMCFSANFSLVDGKRLSFQDIQGKNYNYYQLLLLIDAQLKQSQVKDQLFEDYQQTIADLIRSQDFSNWFFTENGLTIFFSPYEITPNSAGTVHVEIPYSELTNLLKEDYFPAENYTTGGSMYANLFSPTEVLRYHTFAEVIQDSDGEEFLLTTDGAITDVRLEYGAWNQDGTDFQPTATIFACDGISSDTAVVVQCQLPDVMPVLRVSYYSDGVLHTQFITQSGKDGSILLSNS